MTINTSVAPVLNELKSVSFFGTTQDSIAYAGALCKLDLAQQKVVLSAHGIAGAEREKILAYTQGIVAVTGMSAEMLEEKLGLDRNTISKELNIAATDQLTLEQLKYIASEKFMNGALTESIDKLIAETAAKIAAKGATDGLNASLKQSMMLMVKTPMGIVTLLTTLIPLLIAVGKKFYELWQEAHPPLADLEAEYQELNDKIDSTSDEIEKNKDRIEELQALANNGTISIVEQEELDRLVRENELLDQQLKTYEALAEAKKVVVANKAAEDFEDFLNDSGTQEHRGGESFTKTYTGKGGLQNAIQDYKDAKESLEAELDKDENANTNLISTYQEQMADSLGKISDLQSQLINLRSDLSLDKEANAGWIEQVDELLAMIDLAVDESGTFDRVFHEFFNSVDDLQTDKIREFTEYLERIGYDTSNITLEGLTAMFTHAGDAADEAAGKVEKLATKSYDQLKSSAEALSKVQLETNGIFEDGTHLTENAYSAIADLVGSEELLTDCIDASNGYLVTNAEALRSMVDAANAATLEKLQQATSQETLKYHELVGQLQEACDGLYDFSDANMESVDAIMAQIKSTELQIAQFKLLEQQLLGTTNAFDKMSNAKAIDEARDYTDDLSEAIGGLIQSFESGEFGTQFFQEAFKALIPDDVYEQFVDAGAQIDAGWNYLNTKLSRYFSYESGSASIGSEQVTNFITDALKTSFGDSTVFTGSLEDFNLNPQITSLKEFADAMGVTETVAFSLGNAISKYTVGNEDFLSKLSMDGATLETQLYAADQNLAALLEKRNELGRSGQVGTAEWDELDQKIKQAKNDLTDLQKKARTSVQANIEVDSKIEEKTKEVERLQKELDEMSSRGVGVGEMTVKTDQLNTAKQELNELIQEKYNLEEPTEMTVTLALEQVDNEIDEVKARLDEIANYNEEADVYVAVDQGDVTEVINLQQRLNELKAEKNQIEVTFDVHSDEATGPLEEIQSYQFKDKIVKVKADTIAAIRSLGTVATALKNLPTTKTVNVTVHTTHTDDGKGDGSVAYGTAHARGSAFERGNWGLERAEKNALVGELGPEIVVDPRNGRYMTVGEYGAEIVSLPKGAIVFNHRQTEGLLRNRRIDSRGKALAEGNAHFTYLNRKYTFGQTVSSSAGTKTSSGSSSSSSGKSSGGSSGKSGGTSTAAKSAGDAFEDLYKKHQHLLNMDQESVVDYLNWLEGAYQYAYSKGQIELDDYYKYEEEVYDKTKDLLTALRDEYQNAIDLREKWIDNAASKSDFASVEKYTGETVEYYKKMQQEVAKAAKWYREHGFSDTSDEVSELSKLWWEYHDNIVAAITDAYDKLESELDNRITLTENWLDRAVSKGDFEKVRQYTDDIYDYYTQKQQAIAAEAKELRAMGYSDSSDEVSKLSDLWYEYEEKRKSAAVDAWASIVDAAHDALDEIQNVYDTLHAAADEYASMGGYLTIDTYQKLLELGPQYLQYLMDENAQYVIDEENIRKVIAAKTEQMSVDTALAYVERLRLALMGKSSEEIDNLLYATTATTNATWDLVYAQLSLLDLTEDQYAAALHNINAIRSLGDAAVAGIGHSTDELSQGLQDLDDLLQYIMDMLKQRINDQIDALGDMKDAYSEIIDMKKESLEKDKEAADRQKTMADKMKEIAKLQAKIDAISLAAEQGDRKAMAERASLMEEMEKLQEDLSDTQADYTLNAQKDALDEMEQAYHDEKDAEIKDLQDSISSTEKLYRMAMNYLENDIGTDYERLKDELVAWNYEVGNSFETEIVSAWESAISAAERYESLVAAMQMLPGESAASNSKGSGNTDNRIVADKGTYDTQALQVREVSANITRMKQNSRDWGSANKERRGELEAENREYAAQIGEVLYNDRNALRLGSDGWWYLPDGRKLYEVYSGEYHTGGDVDRLGRNEVYAKLKYGETVLDEDTANELVEQIERVQKMQTAFQDMVTSIDKPILSDFIRPDGSTINNVTNNSNRSSGDLIFGDTIINGAAPDAVPQHIKVTEDMMNQIAKWMGLKM